MEEELKMQALLKEYDKLRDEAVYRMSSRFTIVGYVGALLAFFASQTGDVNWSDIYWPFDFLGIPASPGWPIFLLFLSACTLLSIWMRFGYHIKKLSKRLAEIEQGVNQILGEEVLIWETSQRKTGIFHRF